MPPLAADDTELGRERRQPRPRAHRRPTRRPRSASSCGGARDLANELAPPPGRRATSRTAGGACPACAAPRDGDGRLVVRRRALEQRRRWRRRPPTTGRVQGVRAGLHVARRGPPPSAEAVSSTVSSADGSRSHRRPRVGDRGAAWSGKASERRPHIAAATTTTSTVTAANADPRPADWSVAARRRGGRQRGRRLFQQICTIVEVRVVMKPATVERCYV